MTDDRSLRFGVLDLPNAPFSELTQRWRMLEDLGFDFLWEPDHTAYWRDLGTAWFDGSTTLTALAMHTRRVRIGTLVSNPILRHPVMLARQAATVDHLSGGRLELGIGTGVAGFDHAAVGTSYWEPRERARAVRRVRGRRGRPAAQRGPPVLLRRPALLHRRRPGARREPPAAPPADHRRRSVADRAPGRRRPGDCWNTHGPFGATVKDILGVTARQSALIDDLCEAAGRDPRSLRRSLLLVDALDAWRSPRALETIVEQFSAIGIREYTVMWPGDDQRAEIERVATEVIPRLRAELGASAEAGSFELS